MSATEVEEMTDAEHREGELGELPRILESLLFLTPEPVSVDAIADAADCGHAGKHRWGENK